jgi:hypothetical protein
MILFIESVNLSGLSQIPELTRSALCAFIDKTLPGIPAILERRDYDSTGHTLRFPPGANPLRRNGFR